MFFARLLIALTITLAGRKAFADPVKAASADAFVETIGVCTHWRYGDTPYGFAYEGVKKALLACGIRHVRDGIGDATAEARLLDLGKFGVRSCILAEPEVGTPEEIRGKVKALNQKIPGVIDCVEGPNEPDLFWVGSKKSYRGKSGANGDREAVEAAVLFQKDVYAAFKSDPATAKITLIGPSLGKTYEPGKNPIPAGALTDFVDWGNFHPYFGGNPFSFPFAYGTIEKYLWNGTNPSTNMDEFPYAFDTYAPPFKPRPMAATEAGCATDANGTSESAHGKYIPRMFLEYFRKGIKRTYSYEFVDEFADQNNREARFGMLRRDLTPKPAYTALKNLIAVLSDKSAKADFSPGTLDFTLNVSPNGDWNRTQYVHYQLFQKRSGDFYLAIWHEAANEDKSVTPRRQILPPLMPAELIIKTPISAAATLCNWDEKGEMTRTPVTLTGGKLTLQVPDRVMILKLSPPAAPKSAKPPAPSAPKSRRRL